MQGQAPCVTGTVQVALANRQACTADVVVTSSDVRWQLRDGFPNQEGPQHDNGQSSAASSGACF